MRNNRVEAARHASQREKVTEIAIGRWHMMCQRFGELMRLNVADHVLSDARNNAVDAFEAMLDALKTENDALHFLQAIRQSDPRMKRKPPDRRDRPKEPT